MENPPTSECPSPGRGDNVRESVRDGVRLDGERKHQQFREGTPRCRPVGTGELFVAIILGVLKIPWLI